MRDFIIAIWSIIFISVLGSIYLFEEGKLGQFEVDMTGQKYQLHLKLKS
jgi:H+/gluconate symporter-like permease